MIKTVNQISVANKIMTITNKIINSNEWRDREEQGVYQPQEAKGEFVKFSISVNHKFSTSAMNLGK